MAAPTITGTAGSGRTGAGTFTVTPPAGASWLALATIYADVSGATLTPPAGWTQVGSVMERSGGPRGVLYRAESTPGSSWSYTASSAGRPVSVVVVGYGEATNATLLSSVNGASSPSITTTDSAFAVRLVIDVNDSLADATYPTGATLGRVQFHAPEAGNTWVALAAMAHQSVAVGSTGAASWGVPAAYLPVASTLMVASTAPSAITGTATSVLPLFTQAASGSIGAPTYTGTAASVLPAFTQTAAATYTPPVPVTPTGVTLDPAADSIAVTWSPSAAATSYTVEWEVVTSDITGTATSTLPGFTQAATGTTVVPVFTGTATSSLPGFTQAAAGTVTQPEFTGTVTSNLPAFTQAAEATFTPESITGAATSNLPAFGQAATGTTTVPQYDGTITTVLPSFTQAAEGATAVPEFVGVIESTLPTFTQAAEGAAFEFLTLPDDAIAVHVPGRSAVATAPTLPTATATGLVVSPAATMAFVVTAATAVKKENPWRD